jgi:hypothetical protein
MTSFRIFVNLLLILLINCLNTMLIASIKPELKLINVVSIIKRHDLLVNSFIIDE